MFRISMSFEGIKRVSNGITDEAVVYWIKFFPNVTLNTASLCELV